MSVVAAMHAAYNHGMAVSASMPILGDMFRGCAVSRPLRGLGLVLMVIAALSGPRTVAGVWAQPPATPDRSPRDTIREDIDHIARLFYGKQFEAVVRDAEPTMRDAATCFWRLATRSARQASQTVSSERSRSTHSSSQRRSAITSGQFP